MRWPHEGAPDPDHDAWRVNRLLLQSDKSQPVFAGQQWELPRVEQDQNRHSRGLCSGVHHSRCSDRCGQRLSHQYGWLGAIGYGILGIGVGAIVAISPSLSLSSCSRDCPNDPRPQRSPDRVKQMHRLAIALVVLFCATSAAHAFRGECVLQVKGCFLHQRSLRHHDEKSGDFEVSTLKGQRLYFAQVSHEDDDTMNGFWKVNRPGRGSRSTPTSAS